MPFPGIPMPPVITPRRIPSRGGGIVWSVREKESIPTNISSSAPISWEVAWVPPGLLPIDPQDDKAYGLDFPVVTIGDMVTAQKKSPGSSRRQKAPLGYRRIYRRDAGPGMGGPLSGNGLLGHPPGYDHQAFGPGHRLQ